MTTVTPAKSRYKTERGGRMYHVDGDLFPSVTTILDVLAKPGLVGWAANLERDAVLEVTVQLLGEYARKRRRLPAGDEWRAMVEQRLGAARAHQRALRTAGTIGTALHAKVEWTIQRQLGVPVGPEPTLPDEAEWAWMACEDWFRASGFTPLASELVVYSKAHRYAGTVDVVGTIGDVLTVLDFKTSKTVYPEMILQSVAYRKAVQEMDRLEEPPAGLILRLPKDLDDPKPEPVPAGDADELFPVFLAARALWEGLEAMKGGAT